MLFGGDNFDILCLAPPLSFVFSDGKGRGITGLGNFRTSACLLVTCLLTFEFEEVVVFEDPDLAGRKKVGFEESDTWISLTNWRN